MTPLRLWIGLVLLALGVFGILDATGTLESTEILESWWPVAIIGAGIMPMLARRRISLGPIIVTAVGFVLLADQQNWTSEDLVGPVILVIIGFAILAGATRKGGAELDLRGAHIDQEAEVEATAIFGGVDILVPRGWRISVGGLPIFGGYEDKTKGNGSLPADAPRLNVRATAIFGGVGVAHEPD